MYPHDVRLFGADIAIWNVALLVAVIAGYPLLIAAFRLRRRGPLPRLLPLRWLATVYVSALGAQLFAYAFDTHTTLLPPPTVSWLRYYFDPLFAAKTLYGAIVFLPLTALLISVPWRDLAFGEALDCWTPAMFAVLGICRVGCFLQGCCYGMRSDRFGLSFPPLGEIFYSQVQAGLIDEHAAATLPVVPTQALEAFFLFALCAWSSRELSRGGQSIFPIGIVLYSVFRFLVELLRDDVARNSFGPFSTSQWIALVMIGAYGLWGRTRTTAAMRAMS